MAAPASAGHPAQPYALNWSPRTVFVVLMSDGSERHFPTRDAALACIADSPPPLRKLRDQLRASLAQGGAA